MNEELSGLVLVSRHSVDNLSSIWRMDAMISGVVFIILLRLSRRRFLHPPARLQAVSLLLENPLRGTVIETACSVALSASVASLRNSFNSLDTHQGSFANFEVETTLNDTMNSFI